MSGTRSRHLIALALLSTVAAACGDRDDTGDEGSEISPPECACDALIDKQGQLGRDFDGSGDITPGDYVNWTISVAYNGSETCDPDGQVCFEDALPQGLSFVGSVGLDFTCSGDGAAPETVTCCSDSQSAATDFVGSVILSTEVGPDVEPGELENCAALMTGSEKLLPNDETDNDEDCASVEANEAPGVDLQIGKSPGTEFEEGMGAAWDFRVSNGGPGDATGVTLVDTLPLGMSFDASGDPDWLCSGDGASPEKVTCVYQQTLAAGDSADFSFGVFLDGEGREEVVVNCATLTSGQDELNPEDNESYSEVQVALGCREEIEVDLSTGIDDSDGSYTAVTESDDSWMYLGPNSGSSNYTTPMWAIVHDQLGSYASLSGDSQWVSSDADWSSTWNIYYPGGYDYNELTWETCFCVGDDAEQIGLDLEARADDEIVGVSLNGTSLHSSTSGTYAGNHGDTYDAIDIEQSFEVDGKTVVRGTNCLQVTSYNHSTLFSLNVSGAAAVGCGCDEADLAVGLGASADASSATVKVEHKIENQGGHDEAAYVLTSTPTGSVSLDSSATASASPDWSCGWDGTEATCLYQGSHLVPGDTGTSLVLVYTADDPKEPGSGELCATVKSRNDDIDPSDDSDCTSFSF